MTDQFSQACDVYALPGWAEDPKGICVPDVVISALLEALLPAARPVFEKHLELEKKELVPELNRHRILIATPQLSWEQSCKLVAAALEATVLSLGERAHHVVEAKKRWKRVQVEPGDCWGCCVYPEDPSRQKAVIDFGSDGTICDSVYIAHEMGHLLAGDMSQERKLLGKEYLPRKSMGELQSFFTQHALYSYLMNEPRASFLKHEALLHFMAEITRSIYICVAGAAALEACRQHEKGARDIAIKKQCAESLEKMLGPSWASFGRAAWLAENGADNIGEIQNMIWELHAHAAAAIIGGGLYSRYAASDPKRREALIEALYCTGRKNTVLDVFAAAGIADRKELDRFMSDSVWAAVEPLQRFHAESRTVMKRSAVESLA